MEKHDLDTKFGDTRAVIAGLAELLDTVYKEPYPVFTKREAFFLADLLFTKDKDLLLFYIADFMADNFHEGVRVFANGASYRRLEFYKQFWITKGNATKAAIQCGYSPKSAKQQGHRMLRWIQRITMQDTGENTPLSGFKGH